MADLHQGQARLNEIEAVAEEIANWYAPAVRRRNDGTELLEASADAIAAHQAASDLRRIVNYIKSDPDLLNRVVRVLAA